ncbi:MAG: pyridoxamine 5'-phosphate oxidase family protein [Alistipes sp.]
MIDERITHFLGRHHVLTLATTNSQGIPYCSNAFYCYDKERNILIFSAGDETLHAQQMALHPHVAASIALETRIVGKVQGLQICGTAARADEQARSRYLKRFPYAALVELTLWSVTPNLLKLTDNTLGFGKKLIWKISESSL